MHPSTIWSSLSAAPLLFDVHIYHQQSLDAHMGHMARCRLMQQRKIIVDEAVSFILLRLCFNRLREEWYPGGYPPTAGQAVHRHPGETSPAGKRLLQVSHRQHVLPSMMSAPSLLSLLSSKSLPPPPGHSSPLHCSLRSLSLLTCPMMTHLPLSSISNNISTITTSSSL